MLSKTLVQSTDADSNSHQAEDGLNGGWGCTGDLFQDKNGQVRVEVNGGAEMLISNSENKKAENVLRRSKISEGKGR